MLKSALVPHIFIDFKSTESKLRIFPSTESESFHLKNNCCNVQSQNLKISSLCLSIYGTTSKNVCPSSGVLLHQQLKTKRKIWKVVHDI